MDAHHEWAVFCEFEEDQATGYLIHPSGAAAACRVDSMPALTTELKKWKPHAESCSSSPQMPRTDNLRVVLILMGSWTQNGEAEGVVLVMLAVPPPKRVYESNAPQAEHVRLVQLGSCGGSGELFDDLATLRQRGLPGIPRLSRVRIWQSKPSSALKGGIVALQAFYGERHEVLLSASLLLLLSLMRTSKHISTWRALLS
jgi:hypothetical protein